VALSTLVVSELKEGNYFLKFCHSICVFGLDVEEIGRYEAIDGLKTSMTLNQTGIKFEPLRNFGLVLDGLLP